MWWPLLVVLALAGCRGGDDGEPFSPDLAFPPVFDLVPECPARLAPFLPVWSPPVVSRGACTDSELDNFVASVLSGGAAGAQPFINAPGTCGPCLVAASIPPAGTAFIITPTNVIDANVGACVALIDGATGASSCGARVSALDQCLAAACIGCHPVQVSADLVAYDQCLVSAAAEAPCGSMTQPAQCIDAVPGAAKCRSSGWSSTADWLRFVANLFCGPQPD